MTSPSQLKYLEAMGIPVWVSRDSYHDTSVEDSQQAVILHPESVNLSPETDLLDHTPSSKNTNSVESILQSLDQAKTQSRQSTSPLTAEIKHTKVVDAPKKGDNFPSGERTPNEITRTSDHIVYACGDLNADWLIIGESPDLNDERNNQPYEGESGVLLDNMLRAVGINNPRSDAFMINIIKASMQTTTNDSKDELNTFLNGKIKEIKPSMVLVVGQLAAQNLLQSNEPLARLRAKEHKHSASGANIVVTYYPTHLISKPLDKRKAWEDLKLAIKIINNSDITT